MCDKIPHSISGWCFYTVLDVQVQQVNCKRNLTQVLCWSGIQCILKEGGSADSINDKQSTQSSPASSHEFGVIPVPRLDIEQPPMLDCQFPFVTDAHKVDPKYETAAGVKHVKIG